MGVASFLFFIPLTIICVILFAIAAIYLCMGIILLATGLKEKRSNKIDKGVLTVIISMTAAFVVAFVYINWVWIW